jgi:tetratricopeptide (TPR) repeat protein
VSSFLLGLLSTLLATNQPAASNSSSSSSAKIPGKAAAVQSLNDPVEKEYLQLLALDDAAQKEADKWIRDAKAFQAAGTSAPVDTLTARIEQRFQPVRKAYDDFLRRHPNHARGRLAYGSFLYEAHEEDQAVAQWEKAKDIDPNNPAAWNNLGNHYGHRGPLAKAFEHYEKAIELKPDEPVYFQNLATTTYLFRRDAMDFYKISEEQVFDKSLGFYRKAIELDPSNFPLATDLAQSYYGIKPLRVEEAITAWKYALKIANDDIEREGVYTHLARIELNCGRFEEARQHLNSVTNRMYDTLKERLVRNLNQKEAQAKSTNAPAGTSVPTSP